MIAPFAQIPFAISQVAIVVADLEATVRMYRSVHGWGPWSVYEYAPPRLRDVVVRGEPASFTYVGAETEVGGVGIELIQPLTGPSIYQEWLDTRGESLHHVGYWAKTVEESDEILAGYRERGVEILTCGRIDDVSYYYLDTQPVVLEVWTGDMESVRPTRVYNG